MTGARKVLLWAALLALALAVACQAEETDTGPSAAEIENIVKAAVASGDQLTAADVQRIVNESAGQLTAADVRKIVADSAGTQLTASDVQSIVNSSMASQLTAADVQRIVDASAGGQLTAADVRKIVSDSVAGQLTASDVQKIVDASTTGQLSAADVQRIVQASTGDQLTASDVRKIVDASAMGQLTTADVQKIISESVSEAVEEAKKATAAAEAAGMAAKAAGTAAMAAGTAAEAASMDAQKALAGVELQKELVVAITAPVAPPLKYSEAPMLAQLVSAGKLPPVEERLPSEPMVIPVFEEIGKYGGQLRAAFLGRSYSNLERYSRSSIFRFSTDGGTLMPNGAKGLEVSPDGLVTTIFLREGMRWSDGAPFTADDFVYWYDDTQLNEELNTGRVDQLLQGISPEGDGKVVKVDDYTVKFVFPSPITNVAKRLTRSDGHRPAHYLKQFHKKYNPKVEEEAKAAGFENWTQYYRANSQFIINPDVPVLQAWVPTGSLQKDDIVFFERNPYFHAVDPEGNQLPYIDTYIAIMPENQELLTLKLLAGELDFQAAHVNLVDLPLVKQNAEKGDYRVILHPQAQAQDIAIYPNHSLQGPLGDLIRTTEFRQALSVAIDREAINQNVYLGMSQPRAMIPLKSNPFYPGTEYEKKWTQYDPDLANAMLDELLPNKDSDGWRTFADGTRVELIIDSWYAQTTDATLQIPPYWEAVGLKAEFSGLPEVGTLQQEKLHDNSMQFLSAIINFTHPFIRRGSTSPTGWWSFMGPHYGLWEESGGEEGLEPVQYIKDLVATHKAGHGVPVDQQAALGQALSRDFADNVWIIGVLGDTPSAATVKNGLGNVPFSWMGGGMEKGPSTAFVEQFFWKER